jgi:aryl-alcohol dehydrogenase-like predicted oxidoreductase
MGFSPGSDSAGNRKITLGTGGKIGENGKPEPAPARHDKESILEACEASLKRLQVKHTPPPLHAYTCERAHTLTCMHTQVQNTHTHSLSTSLI